MVHDKLMIVFSWLFQAEHKDDELLKPIGGLQQIVALQFSAHLPLRIA